MKKVLLLSCLISMTAQAGTGGGTSTPPARAGLAKLLAKSLGLAEGGDGLLRVNSKDPLPQEIQLQAEGTEAQAIERGMSVEIFNQLGASKVYRVIDGDQANLLILQERRAIIRGLQHR